MAADEDREQEALGWSEGSDRRRRGRAACCAVRSGGSTSIHQLGGEIQKTRPAVIVSNDASNRYLNRVQVVPISSKTLRVFPLRSRD